jgi:hypothetical protein
LKSDSWAVLAPYVVGVALLAVEHVEPGGVGGVLDQAAEQRDPFVVLGHQHVPERWARASDRQDRIVSTNSDCGTVERVDVAGAVLEWTATAPPGPRR